MHPSVYPATFVEFFGPCMWKTMHSVAFTYAADPNNPTEGEKKAAIDFFGSLRYLIPCGSCARHYEKYIALHPIDASSRQSLSRWVYELHSDVNRRRHVPNPSYEEVEKMYTGFVPGRDTMKINSARSAAKKLSELADPHFGRSAHAAYLKSESALGDLPQSAFYAMGGIFLVGALFAGGVYYAGRKTKKEGENSG